MVDDRLVVQKSEALESILGVRRGCCLGPSVKFTEGFATLSRVGGDDRVAEGDIFCSAQYCRTEAEPLPQKFDEAPEVVKSSVSPNSDEQIRTDIRKPSGSVSPNLNRFGRILANLSTSFPQNWRKRSEPYREAFGFC